MKKKLLFAVALWVCSAIAFAEIPNCPTDTINGQIVYAYRVPRSIGLYRISVNFGVTQEEIIQWNPQLRERGLHYDEIIYIPVKNQPAPEPEKPVAESTPVVEETPAMAENVQADTVPPLALDTIVPDSLSDYAIQKDSIKTWKIALMLPLQADLRVRDAAADRFVEFYEGVLLALKDLQTTQKFELFVYDTGKTDESIKALSEDSVLRNMDAIIGPAYPAQVDALSQMLLWDSIPTLIPFTSKIKDLATNPSLMQFNSDEKNEAKALADYLEARKDSINVVLVDGKEADIPNGVKEFRKEVQSRGLSVTRVSIKDILSDSLSKALKDSVENILVFNTERFTNLQILLPHVLNGKGGKQLTLYSRYSWQKEMILLPQIYTSVFATDIPADLTFYEQEFAQYFKHEHETELPRFDLLGYDVTRQLVAWLEGKEYFGLQSDILFERLNENGGWINTKLTVVRR